MHVLYSPFPEATYPQNKTSPDSSCTCSIDLHVLPSSISDSAGVNMSMAALTISASTLSLPNRLLHFADELHFMRQCAAPGVSDNCIGGGQLYLTDGTHTLTDGYTQEHGFCRPLNRYRWGFSSLALLTHLLISITAALVLSALHYDAFCNGRTDRKMLDSNLYSDAVAVTLELDRLAFGAALGRVPGSQLEALVERERASVSIEEDEDDLKPRRVLWQQRRQRRGK